MTNMQVCAAYLIGVIATVSLGLSLGSAIRKSRKERSDGKGDG
jgi:hypothetical protein